MANAKINITDWSPCISVSYKKGCGACCIAPSITSSIPGMPNGKPAGVRCIQLNDNNLCKLFGLPERPEVCHKFTNDDWICGSGPDLALKTLTELEALT
ncbi:YkgJ family cysteine cluster protein [uncultured Photobacterium sp.]|uniref:YkgJ family cysteine cluster protein n=1 Tax=uncultured Photobacterium sp. TaxID=173973 RepID=UPI0026187A92|nr:YkgJ family cysteine cluster protein [uncultured Photobacterium sp.]